MHNSHIKTVTFALLLANCMAGLEGTIISTAMPTIVSDLHGITLMNWIFTVYLLFMAIGTPIWGKIADRIGRKRSFIIGVGIFILSSFLEGLSPNMTFMILARGLMGIGAGGMISIPFIIFAELYPPARRASIFGLTAAFGGAASVSGPLLGGWIVDTFSWHWIFYMNIPIGLLSILLISIYFKDTPKKSSGKIDIAGGLFLSLGLLSLLLGLQLLGQHAKLSVTVILLICAALLFLFIFARVERHAEDPIIPLYLFKNRELLVKNFIAFATMGYYISFSAYIPMWAQGIMATSAIVGGATQIPIAGLWFGGSRVAAWRIQRHSTHSTIYLGLGVAIAGAAALALVGQNTPYWVFIIVGALFGIAFGMLLSTSQVAVTEVVAPQDLAVATTLNRLFNTLGQTVMAAIYGVIFNTAIVNGISGFKNLQLTTAMINTLSNPKTASSLPSEQIGVLRSILFNGIHGVMIAGLVLLVIGFILNAVDAYHAKTANKNASA